MQGDSTFAREQLRQLVERHFEILTVAVVLLVALGFVMLWLWR